MFGSSEDRARQLAYRNRGLRSGSRGSRSSYRSASSASRSSQHSHLSLTSGEDAVRRVISVGYFPQPTILYRQDSLLFANAEKQQHKLEQHRLQTEYLSQVLYNSTPTSTSAVLPAASLSHPATSLAGGHNNLHAKAFELPPQQPACSSCDKSRTYPGSITTRSFSIPSIWQKFVLAPVHFDFGPEYDLRLAIEI